MILDRFFKKKKKEDITPNIQHSPKLPDSLEQFKTSTQASRPDYNRPIEVYENPQHKKSDQEHEKNVHGDKTELILQKLDTIDTRLKLIEEKLKRT